MTEEEGAQPGLEPGRGVAQQHHVAEQPEGRGPPAATPRRPRRWPPAPRRRRSGRPGWRAWPRSPSAGPTGPPRASRRRRGQPARPTTARTARDEHVTSGRAECRCGARPAGQWVVAGSGSSTPRRTTLVHRVEADAAVRDPHDRAAALLTQDLRGHQPGGVARPGGPSARRGPAPAGRPAAPGRRRSGRARRRRPGRCPRRPACGCPPAGSCSQGPRCAALQRGRDLVVGGVRSGEPDVLGDAGAEDVRVVVDQPGGPAYVVEGEVPAGRCRTGSGCRRAGRGSASAARRTSTCRCPRGPTRPIRAPGSRRDRQVPGARPASPQPAVTSWLRAAGRPQVGRPRVGRVGHRGHRVGQRRQSLLGRGRADRERTRRRVAGPPPRRGRSAAARAAPARRRETAPGGTYDAMATMPAPPASSGRTRPAATARAERRRRRGERRPVGVEARRAHARRPARGRGRAALCRIPSTRVDTAARSRTKSCSADGHPAVGDQAPEGADQADERGRRVRRSGWRGRRRRWHRRTPGPRSTPAGRPGAGGRPPSRRRRPRRSARRRAGDRGARAPAGRGRRTPRRGARPAAAAPRRGRRAARRTAAPAGPGRRCARRRSRPSARAPAGAPTARVISQPAVAVRATPDGDRQRPEHRPRPHARTAEMPHLVASDRRPPAGAARCGISAPDGRCRDVTMWHLGGGRGGQDAWSAASTTAGRCATTTTQESRASSREGLEQDLLGDGVEVRGGLVEEHERAVGDDDAGQREAGALPGGEPGAVLAERRVEPVRQAGARRRRARPVRARPQLRRRWRPGRPTRRLSAIGAGDQPGRCGDQATLDAPAVGVESGQVATADA